MLDNGNIKSCGFAEEIVSYIYDEIKEPARRKFEDHLVDCSSCTDEFAGISTARLAMYEYQDRAFAHLPMPEIAIPYAPEQAAAERAGFFAGLSDMWRKPAWSSALAFAGAVAICFGLGFMAINYIGVNQQVAANETTVIQPVAAPLSTNDAISQTVPPVDLTKMPVTNAKAKMSDGREIRPIRASVTTGRRVFQKNLTADVEVPDSVKIEKPVKPKAPVLSTYDDDDDKSLRLADLVDDGV